MFLSSYCHKHRNGLCDILCATVDREEKCDYDLVIGRVWVENTVKFAVDVIAFKTNVTRFQLRIQEVKELNSLVSAEPTRDIIQLFTELLIASHRAFNTSHVRDTVCANIL